MSTRVKRKQPSPSPSSPSPSFPPSSPSSSSSQRGVPVPPAGLVLPDQVIQRISGPVSMYYLLPPPDKPTFPLLLLFGDIHRSVAEMCQPCTKQNRCATIYDTPFLRSLDSIAAKYPIDFYTEYSPMFSTFPPSEGVLFYHFIQQSTSGCHVMGNRTSWQYRAACPTRNIRWHYTDVRFMRRTVSQVTPVIEGSVYAGTEYLFNPSVFPGEIEKLFHRITPKGLLSSLREYHRRTMPRIIHNFVLPRSPLSQTGLQGTVQMIRLVLEGGRDQQPFENMVGSVVSFLFSLYYSHHSSGQSMIFKEMGRFSQGPPSTRMLDNPELWRDMAISTILTSNSLRTDYETFLSDVRSIPPKVYSSITRLLIEPLEGSDTSLTEADVVGLHQWITATASSSSSSSSSSTATATATAVVNNPFLMNILKHVNQLLLYSVSVFVDIYTLLRIFKPVRDSAPPLLAMGYHGNAHTQNMIHMLQQPIFGYTLSYAHQQEHSAPGQMRCIRMADKRIPLTQDMEEHARRAYSTKEEYAKLKAYRDQIRREKQARIQSTPRNQENEGDPDYDYEEPFENVFAPPNASTNASRNVVAQTKADGGRRKQIRRYKQTKRSKQHKQSKQTKRRNP